MQATEQLPAIAATIDRPIVTPGKAARCATCEVRARSVCSAIPDADLARLSAIAVETDVAAGHAHGCERQPACLVGHRDAPGIEQGARGVPDLHEGRRPEPVLVEREAGDRQRIVDANERFAVEGNRGGRDRGGGRTSM